MRIFILIIEYCKGRTFRTHTLPVPVRFLPVPYPYPARTRTFLTRTLPVLRPYPYVSYPYPARTRMFLTRTLPVPAYLTTGLSLLVLTIEPIKYVIEDIVDIQITFIRQHIFLNFL